MFSPQISDTRYCDQCQTALAEEPHPDERRGCCPDCSNEIGTAAFQVASLQWFEREARAERVLTAHYSYEDYEMTAEND